MITIRSPKEIEKLRYVNELTATVLRAVAAAVAPGMTTDQLDRMAEEMICAAGARPAFKGYQGFPKTICSSIDNEVVHGIPSERKLEEGQILSIDMGVHFGGYFGDAAVTVPVGEVSEEKHRLMRVTERALELGIGQAVAGNVLEDIARAIQTHVEQNGFSVVRQFVGHGIGTELHEPPRVPNYVEDAPRVKLRRGMVIAIEPMVNVGGHEVRVLDDLWTAVTCDGRPSAHFEHTIAVMDDSAEVLTVPASAATRAEAGAHRAPPAQEVVADYGEGASDRG